MSHILQDKSDKMRESTTYWGLKELPLKPHISQGGGGGGVKIIDKVLMKIVKYIFPPFGRFSPGWISNSCKYSK